MILLFGIAFYLAVFALPFICSYIFFKRYDLAMKIALSTIVSFSGSWLLFIINIKVIPISTNILRAIVLTLAYITLIIYV